MFAQFTIEAISQIAKNNIPAIKGVYCFLTTEEGVTKINELRPDIDLRLSDLTEVKLASATGYLLYVGQAGARNSGREINSGHLRQRFEWHVLQNHTSSVIRNKALSSFRATVGSILMDNLMLSEAQVNSFLKDYLYFGYKAVYSADATSILSLESSVIEKYKPILNSRHNPHAKKGVNHPAARIASLRRQVHKLTLRHCSQL